jgi:itaconate CoA-transferase
MVLGLAVGWRNMSEQNTAFEAQPLAGIVVVSVEQAISVPFATRQMADLGATVVKIERRDGGDFARHYDGNVDGQSAFFVWANRGKQSVALDTKDPIDRATLDALLQGADVYLHNLAPDAAQRAGLDAAAVRARNPAIIACEISGYGDGGPRSSDKAYDLAIQAEAGVFDVTGDGAVRGKVGFSVADIAAGMYAFSGVLAALLRRERTGVGATLSISMLEALTEWMSAPLINARALGQTPARTSRRHAVIAPYGTFPLADGSGVLLAIQNQNEWERLCRLVLLAPEMATDERFASNPARIANVDLLEELMRLRLCGASAVEVRERIAAAELAWASVNTLADVWEHEQLRARDRFVPTTLPGGAVVETLRLPIAFADAPPMTAVSIPALNEHDAEVVRRLAQR